MHFCYYLIIFFLLLGFYMYNDLKLKHKINDHDYRFCPVTFVLVVLQGRPELRNEMSNLVSRQRKAFIGQAAPTGYVPGLGRG